MSRTPETLTADDATFRRLAEEWLEVSRRDSVLLAARAATDPASPLYESRAQATIESDRALSALEQTLIDLTLEAVGPAPAAVRAGRFLIAVGHDANVPEWDGGATCLTVVDLEQATTLPGRSGSRGA